MGTNHHTVGVGYKLKQRISSLNPFTPKTIIINAVKDKLKNTGVERLILTFNTINDTYNVMIKQNNNTSLKLDIEAKEVDMIKKLFVNRIKYKFEENHNQEVKTVIIQMNLDLDTDDVISIFIEDTKNNVVKFEY